MKQALFLSILAFNLSIAYGQVKDIEGNTYKTVEIGNYTIMAENLNVGFFRNGDKIMEAKTNEEWLEAGKNGIPAWCYYDNDPAKGKKYGKLYNVYVFEDSRNIAPDGWKMVEFDTWDSLKSAVGYPDFWTKMKSTKGWKDTVGSVPGTNETGFNLLAGGYRSGKDGMFHSEGRFTYFWLGLYKNGTQMQALGISYNNTSGRSYIQSVPNDFTLGVQIRCEKENTGLDYFSMLQEEFLASMSKKDVMIGKQKWMTENLDTEKFANGDKIPEAKSDEAWATAAKNGQPAWCIYKDKTGFGKLYNWYAVNDPRGLAPSGWHIPTWDEVQVLEKFLGSKEEAGKKMKTTTQWIEQGGSTNSSGFSALPGGFRLSDGGFMNAGMSGSFWTTTRSSDKIRPVIQYQMSVGPLNYYLAFFGQGFSVRCVKD